MKYYCYYCGEEIGLNDYSLIGRAKIRYCDSDDCIKEFEIEARREDNYLREEYRDREQEEYESFSRYY